MKEEKTEKGEKGESCLSEQSVRRTFRFCGAPARKEGVVLRQVPMVQFRKEQLVDTQLQIDKLFGT